MAVFSGVWQINCPIIGHVLILALDTSSPSGSVAVLRDDIIIASVSTSTAEVYSARMFRHVEFLLQELSLRLDEFDLFAVAVGPGSFTGLRVGLAAVKGWAEVYRKPVAAISGLEAVAVQSHSKVPLLVPVLDARRSQIYFGFYRRLDASRLALGGDECVATPEEFLEALDGRAPKSGFALVSPVPVLVRELLSRLETRDASPAAMPIDEVSPILAPHVGKLGYLRALRGELSDALTLDANYVRRSDAELHWKDPRSS
ncbi:MAG TPA: tRNA (adenosine(37)-N6)-threonylcarbamoyltransferase complex dimerization subunit type 1 TsaB [Candidatus Acidoferrales bacterium]|jgi:tRNA threonylcarbamoyladenosine biosynthesis protein TsaB|nr:tRNA (adenosine(37)-N6)-threonylcarbamoyltransferase complex dimerization subunit type 1 TsaB [Candidatus Acidoferrales bacterium]